MAEKDENEKMNGCGCATMVVWIFLVVWVLVRLHLGLSAVAYVCWFFIGAAVGMPLVKAANLLGEGNQSKAQQAPSADAAAAPSQMADDGAGQPDSTDDDSDIVDDEAHRLLITKDQFYAMRESFAAMVNFCGKLAENNDVKKYMTDLLKDKPGMTADKKTIVGIFTELMMKDVFACMARMGHQVENLSQLIIPESGSAYRRIDCGRKEGQALLALLYIIDSTDAGYDSFKYFCVMAITGQPEPLTNYFENRLAFYVGSTTGVETDADVHDYQLALVLRSINLNDESQRYKQLLYGVAHSFADADEEMTEEETAFLKELAADAGIASDDGNKEPEVDPIEQLNGLIGLDEVKKSIRSLANFIDINRKREAMGMKVPRVSYHCVFTGNPGTGKTTVARILAGIYRKLGVVEKGQLVETDRSGLVAEYVGQTAVKTNKVIDKALGGVLFIDEAYSLISTAKEDFGKEAITTLLKRMEDDRDKLVVVLAGYSKEMEDFINSNPGLRSRFSRYIHFPDYTADELYQIFLSNMSKFDFKLAPDAEAYLRQLLEYKVAHKGPDFGNGREVRNLFEKVVEVQADRLQHVENLNEQQLSEITVDDIRNAS